jgi:hypothetical protein
MGGFYAMKKMMIITYEAPAGATKADVEDFVIAELQSAGGCRHPEDPLFESLKDVKVIYHRKA